MTAEGIGKALNGVGANSGSKILQNTIKGGALGGSFGLSEGIYDEGVDYAVGDKELTTENLKASGKKILTETAGGIVTGGVLAATTSVLEKVISNINLNSKNISNATKTAIDINKEISKIAEKYPNLEAKDIKALVEMANKNGHNPLVILQELEKGAKSLSEIYKGQVQNLKDGYTKIFGELATVESIGVRSKGDKSVLSKLVSKYSKGKLNSTEIAEIAKQIGDGYGTRVILKDLNKTTAKEIVENALKGKMSYEEFIQNATKIDSLDSTTKKTVLEVINKLKEAQTEEVANTFIEKIKNGTIQLADDEFNNYGSEISSYFTDKQLKRIAMAYESKTNKPLTIVNKTDLNELYKDAQFIKNESGNFVTTNTKKAVKPSGYTTTQGNIKTKYTTGSKLADTEIQIRGSKVNQFAEIEHLPYDIRQGKATGVAYSHIRDVMRGMSEESYKKYSKYLSETYQYYRLQELGIPTTTKPTVPTDLNWADIASLPHDLRGKVTPGKQIDEKLLQQISEEGLVALHK